MVAANFRSAKQGLYYEQESGCIKSRLASTLMYADKGNSKCFLLINFLQRVQQKEELKKNSLFKL